MIRLPGLSAALVLSLLGAGGCVSEERHDRALAEIKRLQLESYQRSYEAAQLRQLLDRVTVELRTREPVNAELVRHYGVLADRYNDLAGRCAGPTPVSARADDPLPPLLSPPTAAAARPPAPVGRQIDDHLFDDRR